MASTLPQFNVNQNFIDVEADAAEVQRGTYSKPTFYADVSKSSAHQIFMAGVNAALSFSGQRSRKEELIFERTETSGYRLTYDEFSLLQKRALSISTFAKIPYDTVEDFLVILCFINNLEDMIKIADCVQIPELAVPTIMLQPMQILNLPGLEKISFAAQALDGLVNMYRKYIQTAQNTVNKSSSGDDIGSIFNALSSIMGGMGGLGERLETGEMGNFLSELITGKRVPTNIIAKNPMMQAPSYVGKSFFGEGPNAMANVDIDQLFNKMIAVFPQPSNGSGTSSFSMQNFGSFSRSMPLTNFVSKILTGSSTIGSTRKLNLINSVVDQINSFTGSTSNETVDITRADNAIPIMQAVSTSLSGMNKSVFSGSTFQSGWSLAQSVGNQLAVNNPNFMEAARKFL